MNPGERLHIDKLEWLLEEATPGPWSEGVDGNPRLYGPDGQHEHSGLIASSWRREDLRLIVALRNAAPALIKAARALDRITEPEAP